MIVEPLGQILIEAGAIDERQLAHALDMQQGTERRIGELLAELGYVEPIQVAQALARQFSIPFYALDEEFKLERDEIHLIPESIARRYCLIPHCNGDDEVLTVIMGNPIDLEAIDAVQRLTGRPVRKAVSTVEMIGAVIDRFYREDAHIERNLREIIELEALQRDPDEERAEVDLEQLRVFANDAPVVRFVNLILMEAVRDNSSDIHFEPGERTVSVRLRTDGILREVPPPPKSLYPAVVTRIKILAKMDIAERRLPLDGRFRFRAHGHRIDVRVSSLPEVHGEKLVLRLLDQDSMKLDLREIGFEPALLSRFQRILESPNGIVLLTGPTGSGKTTTLYSALNYLRCPEKNIQTVEDPVEYQLPGINQMQTKPTIGLDFANALRAIVRQDPDIILIGEIRDLDTAQIAMRASLTGHLVLSTLHTNDAPAAFSRLRDIGIPPYLIAATLRLVIAQRLVRRICRHCRRETPAPAAHLETLRAVCGNVDGWTFHAGAGCRHCGNTGYRGRMSLFEFLEVTPSIASLVAEGASETVLRERAEALGMQNLGQYGLDQVRQGLTTTEEVLSVWQAPGVEIESA
jgi:type IV pilus assembly protein PilB